MAESQFIEHIPCPVCGSSDAGGLYADGTCKCHKCGARWAAEGLEEDAEPDPAPSMPAGLLPFTIVPLPARGIARGTCEKWQYGWSRDPDFQVANYFDRSGRIAAQKLRGPDKSFRWRGDPSTVGLYGENLWRDGGKMLIVTEGEIDALTVSQLQGNRFPVASVPNGAGGAPKDVARSLGWLETFDRVVFMFDEDEPGHEAAERCAAMLTPGKGYIARLPLKDPNEMLKAGRGREVMDAAWGAKPWRPAGIVTGPDLLAVMREGPEATVARWPYPDLDRMSLGIQRGNVVLIAAGVGSGKTTLLRGFVSSFLDQGLKVGVIPLEETVRQFGVGLLSTRVGRNLAVEDGLDGLPPEFDAEMERIAGRLVFCRDDGDRRSATVIDAARYMALAEGCGIVLIDPITVVIGAAAGDDDRRFAERFMLEIEALAKRTGVPIVVVAHLRKPGDGKAHEEGRRVTMSDIRGTGLIGALSHKIMAYERDQQGDGPPVGQLRWLKNRLTGRVGKADALVFVEATGRLEVTAMAGELPPIVDDPLELVVEAY